tara:strand:- start:130 stop:342 length:213 start_codon:yes stop_codon:yes gene_type:complete
MFEALLIALASTFKFCEYKQQTRFRISRTNETTRAAEPTYTNAREYLFNLALFVGYTHKFCHPKKNNKNG